MIDRKQGLLSQRHPMIDLTKWQKTIDLVTTLFDAPCGSITQYLDDEFTILCVVDSDAKPGETTFPWDMKTYCRKVIETGEVLYINQADEHEEWKNSSPVQHHKIISYLGFPITWPDGELFGSICVYDRKGTSYDKIVSQVLAQFRDLINADLALACQYDEMKRMSITDDMTQCYNRRGLFSLEQHETGLAERFRCGLGVVFLDIDNLKKVNDISGHRFGDKAIMLLADVLRMTARTTDIIARIGGDEFVLLVLLNESRSLDALLERITDNYRLALRDSPELEPIDVSIGSQSYAHGHIPVLADMLKQADILMYKNKIKHKESCEKE